MSREIHEKDGQWPGGLSPDEVVSLRNHYGKNTLGPRRGIRVLREIKDIVVEPMFLVLVFTGVLYFLMARPREGTLMLVALFIVGTISFYQDMKRHRALSALRDYTEPLVKTVRGGQLMVLQGWELVPGDVILLEEGEKVPADAVVLRAHDLTVNESVITGESLPVDKDASEGRNKILLGSMLNTGSCYARVTGTGTSTFLGKMGRKMAEIPAERTSLQRQILGFVRVMAIFGISAFLVVWAINYSRSGDLAQSFLLGLTLAMTAIPEEIPIAFSSFLALGGWRMAKLGIIVSRPAIMDYLATVTTICLDKTGTLTLNKMNVCWLYDCSTGIVGEMPSESGARVLWYGRLASEAEPFDAMERAIVGECGKLKDAGQWNTLTVVHEYPLQGHPPMMTHVYRDRNGALLAAAKGAPERILSACRLPAGSRDDVSGQLAKITAKGYRVLAVASADGFGSDFPRQQDDFDWKFEGLIGFFDPPKPGLRTVFETWRKAGIRVKILSGDYPATVETVAAVAGLQVREVLTGREVTELSDEVLRRRVKEVDIYARMFPDAKLRVVQALKESGEIVAMTGDGVNDGLALKAAHIGIAMGKAGTDLARQAADLVISDDDLSRITESIVHGRTVHGNLKKAIRYLIGIHIPIILTVSLPLLLGWKYTAVFTPIHIVFLELIMGPTCSIFYEREPAEPGILNRRSAVDGKGFFTRRETVFTVLQGLMAALTVLAVYFYFVQRGASITVVRTAVFLEIVLLNLVLTFVSRSFTQSVFAGIRYRNSLTGAVLAMSAGFMGIIMGIPSVRGFFGMVPLRAVDIGLVFGVAMICGAAMETMKRVGRIPSNGRS